MWWGLIPLYLIPQICCRKDEGSIHIGLLVDSPEPAVQKEVQENRGSFEQHLATVSKQAGIGGVGLVVGNLLTYGTMVLAARVVGAELFGLFHLGFTIFLICVVIAGLGLNQGVLRFVSSYIGLQDDARLKGTIILGARRTFIAGCGLAAVVFLTAPVLANHIFFEPGLTQVLRGLMLALPCAAMLEVLLATLQGSQRISWVVGLRHGVQPVSRLLLMVALFVVGFRLSGIIWATVFSVIATFGLAFLCVKQLYASLWGRHAAVIESNKIQSFSWPLCLDGLLHFAVVSLPLLMLGKFGTMHQVGLYAVGAKLGLAVSLPLMACNQIFAPVVANLYARGEKTTLKMLFKTTTKWIFTLSLAVALIILLLARDVLALFGAEFIAATTALYLIVMGELVNAGVGSVGLILVMTGRPRISLLNSAMSLVLTLVVGAVVIPKYGLVSAALVAALTVAFTNLVRLWQVFHFEKMQPFGRSFLKPIVAGGLAAVGVILFRAVTLSAMAHVLLSLTVFGAVFVVALIVLRLDREDKFIVGLIGRRLGKAA